MIAQRARVVAEQVGHFEDRKAVEDGGDGGALRDIAGIQQNAILAALALAPDHGGQEREAAVVVFQRHHARVQVVGVQDGQRADFRGQRSAGK